MLSTIWDQYNAFILFTERQIFTNLLLDEAEVVKHAQE
jgi:hypothetical protein